MSVLFLGACVNATQTGILSILTYNVHGLPGEVTGDDTFARMADIGERLPYFDLVGLQEDFDEESHEALLMESTQLTQRWFSARYGVDRFYGSGLTLLADFPAAEYQEEHFVACHGVLSHASDCLASKGFQRALLTLADGLAIEVYNTHLDAGSSEEDIQARHSQLMQLLTQIQSTSRPILLFGDTNLRPSRPEDESLIEWFLEESGLEDSCEAVGCAETDHIDRIWFRAGAENGLQLSVASWENDTRFYDGSVPLSDHPAIVSTLDWRWEP